MADYNILKKWVKRIIKVVTICINISVWSYKNILHPCKPWTQNYLNPLQSISWLVLKCLQNFTVESFIKNQTIQVYNLYIKVYKKCVAKRKFNTIIYCTQIFIHASEFRHFENVILIYLENPVKYCTPIWIRRCIHSSINFINIQSLMYKLYVTYHGIS